MNADRGNSVINSDRRFVSMLTLSIDGVRIATASEWDQIWKHGTFSTYFHSREWAEVWSRYTNGKMRPASRIVEFSDGATALLPLSTSQGKLGLGQRILSSPAGTYGGWISEKTLQPEHRALLAQMLCTKFRGLEWRRNPFEQWQAPSASRWRADFTQVCDLRNGMAPLEAIWKKEQQRKVRKAQRAGVTIRLASTSLDWDQYYEVYQDSLRRWGERATSRYGRSLFSEFARCDPERVKLWLAEYEGKIVAGALCLYAAHHVSYWHGSALAQYFHLYPVNLLFCAAITEALERKAYYFDFNPSGGHAGVTQFKRSFGAIKMESQVFEAETMRSRLSRLLKRLT